jgi:hypothetical protein
MSPILHQYVECKHANVNLKKCTKMALRSTEMVVARLCPELGRLLLAPLELVGAWVATLLGCSDKIF